MYLYRGVSEELYNKLNGKLKPKEPKQEFASSPSYGAPQYTYGSGAVFGKASVNSVLTHQWKQKGLPTSGVSSSPLIERARFYALSGGNSSKGYIFKLSVKLLEEAGVNIYRVNDLITNPAIPEDDEHVLVSSDFDDIPESAIVSVSVVETDI